MGMSIEIIFSIASPTARDATHLIAEKREEQFVFLVKQS
jgi:hypothetical protein